jgi:hypothetical protein
MPKEINPYIYVYRPGQVVSKEGVYIFRCPVCQKIERTDDKYGLACTGPGSQDTHEMTPMDLEGLRMAE